MKKHKKLIFAFFIKSVCNVFFFFFAAIQKAGRGCYEMHAFAISNRMVARPEVKDDGRRKKKKATCFLKLLSKNSDPLFSLNLYFPLKRVSFELSQ